MLRSAPMFEHLAGLPPDFSPEASASPAAVLDGMYETAVLLDGGAAPMKGLSEAERQAAHNAFAALTTHTTLDQQKAALKELNVPTAVKQLVGMLTSYDWQFVKQAQEIRGYCVAKLVEEVENPDPRIRLQAIKLLGTVTEVALFTERKHVQHDIHLSEAELDAEINARMEKYMGLLKAKDALQDQDVIDVETELGIDLGPDEHPTPEPEKHPE